MAQGESRAPICLTGKSDKRNYGESSCDGVQHLIIRLYRCRRHSASSADRPELRSRLGLEDERGAKERNAVFRWHRSVYDVPETVDP
jgi:hypothetical protein